MLEVEHLQAISWLLLRDLFRFSDKQLPSLDTFDHLKAAFLTLHNINYMHFEKYLSDLSEIQIASLTEFNCFVNCEHKCHFNFSYSDL